MNFENLENIISLFCNIVGLLLCVFKYIETPKRGYRYIIAFFLANILSEYYWTIYQFVMGDYPDVSEFIAYLGWNVAYVCLLIAVFFMRNKGARHYFHPLIFIPVVTNIPQFIYYISFGAVLNNIWEVGITTLTMVFCMQEFVFCWKNRKDKKIYHGFPWLSLLVMVYLVLQYGMWTSSCFDWSTELLNPYLYCSVFGSLIFIFFSYGARRYYEAEHKYEVKIKSASEQRLNILMQAIVVFLVAGICIGGFIAAFRIKRLLISGDGIIKTEEQLVYFLFGISVILILIVLLLIFFLTAGIRKIREKNRKMDEVKRSRLDFIITIAVTFVLMVSMVVYNSQMLYQASVLSLYEDGEEEIKTVSMELENYLNTASTTLRVTADSVDLMYKAGYSGSEIEKYIMDQTKKQSEQFDENFTGFYAYIDGEYLDGLGWVPPEDYDPTSRDWYKEAAGSEGKTVIVPPYVDAQTGSVVVTFVKTISNGNDDQTKNVVCLDVIVNYIKEIIQTASVEEKGYGIVVNNDGFIVSHSDEEFDGKNISDIYEEDILNTVLETQSGRTAVKLDGDKCTLFIYPILEQWYSVIVVTNAELLEETYSQLIVNILVSFIVFGLITFLYYIGYKNEKISGKKVEEMNIQVVAALATAIDAKDNYTNGHSSRVAEYARMIAARAGYTGQQQDEIYMIGLLHDVGKIGVPDSVINKPSKLTDEEFELIKKHPVIGNDILKSIKGWPKLATGARWHHERYGGGGYPDGIKGEEIPEEARIIAVADAYDAMTSRRSYRNTMTQEQVRSEIERGRGTQFDPKFADIMLQMIDEDKEYSMREKTVRT